MGSEEVKTHQSLTLTVNQCCVARVGLNTDCQGRPSQQSHQSYTSPRMLWSHSKPSSTTTKTITQLQGILENICDTYITLH